MSSLKSSRSWDAHSQPSNRSLASRSFLRGHHRTEENRKFGRAHSTLTLLDLKAPFSAEWAQDIPRWTDQSSCLDDQFSRERAVSTTDNLIARPLVWAISQKMCHKESWQSDCLATLQRSALLEQNISVQSAARLGEELIVNFPCSQNSGRI